MGVVPLLTSLLLLTCATTTAQARLICAVTGPDRAHSSAAMSAKPTGRAHSGDRRAVVLFAAFEDGQTWSVPPAWGSQLLDPAIPGSLSHFYDTMSFGKLRVRGELAPRVYRSGRPAADYVVTDPTEEGGFGEFSLEVVQLGDGDVDFASFDNDGPDGIPNSGDDDGVVDAVFIVVQDAPPGFILGPATGVGLLGEWEDYETDDAGADGAPIRISATQGALQQGASFAEAAGAMCHEFGHVLGLPDLYNTDYLLTPDAPPEEDSAGIGAWGLMGWGALGWGDVPGPNSLCAWSRMRLGWAQVVETEGGLADSVVLEQVGATGQMVRIQLTSQEYLLLEYRRRSSSYYDRGIPGEGLLIWHVGRAEYEGEQTPWWHVDLECADGLWADAGYPLGATADPTEGGDNLDFWAHDAEYAAQHGGNWGDATDPFDGVRFDRFTPYTNPAAVSDVGRAEVRLEGIDLDGDRLRLQVLRSPLSLALLGVAPQRDRVAAGTIAVIAFRVANQGASLATGVRAELSTESEALEILDPIVPICDLAAGRTSFGATVSESGFPRVRFPEGLEGEHTAEVEVRLIAGGEELARGTAAITGVPSHRVSVTVEDEEGNPLPGIAVRVREPWNVTVQTDVYYENLALSDSAGKALFRVPEGAYTVYAQADGDSPWGSDQVEDLWVGDDVGCVLRLPRVYVLSGVVRDEQGEPVGGQYIAFERMEGTSRRSTSFATMPDGTFSYRVPAGEVRISTRDYADNPRTPVQSLATVVVDGDMVLDLVMRSGVTLNIAVVDEAGAAVDGVSLYVRDANAAYYSSSMNGLTVDGEGASMAVMPGDYRVSFGDPQPPYLPIATIPLLAIEADTTVRVELQRGSLVEVQLVDENGEPAVLPLNLSGSLYLTATNGVERYQASLYAGAQGGSLGVAQGRYGVRLQMSMSPFEHEPFFPSQGLGTIDVRGDTTVVLVLHPGVSVTGRVRGSGGAASGQVTWSSAEGTYYSADISADGTYSLILAPGLYSVEAGSYSSAGSSPLQDLGAVEVVGDTVIDWSLMADRKVEGRVTGADGRGVGNLSLVLMATIDGLDVRTATTTQDDGAFALRLPDGRYTVRGSMTSLGGDYTHLTLADLIVPSAEAPVLVMPGGSVVHCSAVGGDGQPIAAMVSFGPAPFDLMDYVRHSTESWQGLQATLASGGPHRLDLSPGLYSVVMLSLEWTPQPYYRIVPELLADGELDLELECPSPEETVRLCGAVADDRGEPAADAGLFAYAADLGLMDRVPVQDGRYETVLPPAEYEVVAWSHSEDSGYSYHRVGRVLVDSDQTWDIRLGDGTAVAAAAARPERFGLEQNYPNPFNAETVIGFCLEAEGRAVLELYDLLGQRVRTLTDGTLASGPHTAVWDGRDERGAEVSSGVYLCRLRSGGRVEARKMLLVR